MMFLMMWTFFKIGLFTIGGGYAMIPLISQELLGNGWMTASEITDLIAIAKMTPGPFAVNAATFAGMKILGPIGAVACTVGVILPSLIITSIVAKFFFNFQNLKIVKGILKGIRPTVVALIASAIITVSTFTLFHTENISSLLIAFRSIEIPSIIILAVSLLLLLKIKLHPILVIIISGVAGIFIYQILPMFYN